MRIILGRCFQADEEWFLDLDSLMKKEIALSTLLLKNADRLTFLVLIISFLNYLFRLKN